MTNEEAKLNELGGVEHMKFGWDDGCMCDPCVTVREIVRVAIAEAQAAERERCAAVVESLEVAASEGGSYQLGIGDSAKRVRSLSPDSNWLKRQIVQARIKEHGRACTACLNRTGAQGDDDCPRYVELQAELQALPEVKP
jgi:hypothetical protein